LNRSLLSSHLYIEPQGGDALDQSKTKERILDDYLVAAARLGDRRAFGLLAQRWNRKLLAHAWRLLADEESAKDAVQDAWAEIVRDIAKLDDARAFPAWAYRIVSRRCTRLIGRARRRRQADEAILAEPVVQANDPPAATDIEKLRAAIRELPPGQRAAVALFHLEEMSIAEVAVALDIPAGTVKSRLLHARQKLRAALEGE
jgi:RNA polymerase sigma factor (sigma-70 family)